MDNRVGIALYCVCGCSYSIQLTNIMVTQCLGGFCYTFLVNIFVESNTVLKMYKLIKGMVIVDVKGSRMAENHNVWEMLFYNL